MYQHFKYAFKNVLISITHSLKLRSLRGESSLSLKCFFGTVFIRKGKMITEILGKYIRLRMC